MEFNFTFIISVLITNLGMVWRAKIKERGKIRRIEKLKELEDSKIKSIRKYEKASSF